MFVNCSIKLEVSEHKMKDMLFLVQIFIFVESYDKLLYCTMDGCKMVKKPEPRPKNTSVLVLNSVKSDWSRPAMVISPDGSQHEVSCFEPGEKTQAYMSCSITWQNQMHIFGGELETKQISRLSGSIKL